MIPIDINLAMELITLRVAILFSIFYALTVIIIFGFVRAGSRRNFLIAGFFVSAVLAALLERVI